MRIGVLRARGRPRGRRWAAMSSGWRSTCAPAEVARAAASTRLASHTRASGFVLRAGDMAGPAHLGLHPSSCSGSMLQGLRAGLRPRPRAHHGRTGLSARRRRDRSRSPLGRGGRRGRTIARSDASLSMQGPTNAVEIAIRSGRPAGRARPQWAWSRAPPGLFPGRTKYRVRRRTSVSPDGPDERRVRRRQAESGRVGAGRVGAGMSGAGACSDGR